MSLEGMMASGLPLNRKERFYTGTVFPMIVCAENFRHFDRFTALLPDYRPVAIDWRPGTANVQLFTEYSFVESVYGMSRQRFAIPPKAKNTPDVMILIRGERTVLIALEAKVFDNPVREQMAAQMLAQREILDYLQRELAIDDVYHVALLPEKLARSVEPLGYPVSTWEALLDAFGAGREEDYFMAVLRIALEQYDDLVARGAVYGANNERKMTGAEIYRLFKIGSGPGLIGRGGGLTGPRLLEDVATGRWRTQSYETRTDGEAPNSNWFTVAQFVELVDGESWRSQEDV